MKKFIFTFLGLFFLCNFSVASENCIVELRDDHAGPVFDGWLDLGNGTEKLIAHDDLDCLRQAKVLAREKYEVEKTYCNLKKVWVNVEFKTNSNTNFKAKYTIKNPHEERKRCERENS